MLTRRFFKTYTKILGLSKKTFATFGSAKTVNLFKHNKKAKHNSPLYEKLSK